VSPILVCIGLTSAFAATFQFSRSDLPVTLNIGPENPADPMQSPLLQIRFTDDKFVFENGGGQTYFYSTAEAALTGDPTQIKGLFRIGNNADGMGEVNFATDPATFPTLPPLPPILDFDLDLFVPPGEAFQGQGPVELIVPMPGVIATRTYVSTTRVCNASTGLGVFYCGPTALPDTQFQLTIDLVSQTALEIPALGNLALVLLALALAAAALAVVRGRRAG